MAKQDDENGAGQEEEADAAEDSRIKPMECDEPEFMQVKEKKLGGVKIQDLKLMKVGDDIDLRKPISFGSSGR